MGAMIRVMIKAAAKRRGYENAYQFGRSIGVKGMVASRIWKNSQFPKLKTLDRICNAWGCGLDELIAHKRDAPQEKPETGKRTRGLPPRRSSGKKVSPKTKAAKLSGSKRGR